jgi:hypothetical protein
LHNTGSTSGGLAVVIDGTGALTAVTINASSSASGLSSIAAGAGNGISGKSATGSGVRGETTSSGVGVEGVAGNAKAGYFSASTAAAVVEVLNGGYSGLLGPDVRFHGYLQSTGFTVATLPTPVSTGSVNGILYCTDGKNILNDGAAAGSIVVGGGTGTWVGYANGSWRILC